MFLQTERLILRTWRPEDRAPFAAINSDPEVVRYLPGPLSREESDAMLYRILNPGCRAAELSWA